MSAEGAPAERRGAGRIVDRASLSALLEPHLAQQRWYGAKHLTPEIVSLDELQAPWPGLVRVVVGAGGDRYQLLLGLRPPAEAPDLGESATLGLVGTPAGPACCYDALADPELALVLLHHIAPSQDVTTARPIGAEQSNTSLVYDERVILKVFRRLAGANPEIEVTLGLAERGFDHVAEPLAVWRTNGDDLAVLQRFLSGGVEGWAMALTSVRDLVDAGVDPAESGADLAPEAGRLGLMTAELHLAMAAAFGTTPARAGEWVDAAADRVAAVGHPDLKQQGVDAIFDRVRAVDPAGLAIRVHGDYHLAQVMLADDGWYVLDFEGEPARPVEERRRPTSALRDVAGMLRSFDYAAAVGGGGAEDRSDLLLAWERRNREAFLTEYLARLEGSPLLPPTVDDTLAVLSLFELEKAAYEVAYEEAHRPDWVGIPLAAVRRLAVR